VQLDHVNEDLQRAMELERQSNELRQQSLELIKKSQQTTAQMHKRRREKAVSPYLYKKFWSEQQKEDQRLKKKPHLRINTLVVPLLLIYSSRKKMKKHNHNQSLKINLK